MPSLARSALFVLPLLVAFQAISTDLYLPALPAIILDLDSDVAQAQLTLSVFLAGFALAQLVYGPMSDRFGRRPLLLVGTALYALASLACMLAPSIEFLIAARLVQSVGACSGAVLGRAVIRDVYEPAEAARVLAYIASAMSIAPAAGPVLGGWLTVLFGWRATFAALAIFGLVGLAAASTLPETNCRRDVHALRLAMLLGNCRLLLSDRRYLARIIVAGCLYSGIFVFISGSSHVLIDLVGLTPDQFGWCFAAAVIGWASGSFAGARLNRRLGLERLLLYGTRISAVAGLCGLGLALVLPAGILMVVLPMLVFLVGAGMTLPATIALAIDPYPTRAGLASALLGCLQLLMAAAAGVLLSLVYDQSAVPMMGALALVAMGGLLVAPLAAPRP